MDPADYWQSRVLKIKLTFLCCVQCDRVVFFSFFVFLLLSAVSFQSKLVRCKSWSDIFCVESLSTQRKSKRRYQIIVWRVGFLLFLVRYKPHLCIVFNGKRKSQKILILYSRFRTWGDFSHRKIALTNPLNAIVCFVKIHDWFQILVIVIRGII